MGPPLGLFPGRRRLQRPPLGPQLGKAVIAAGIQHQLLVFEMQDMADGTVQKATIMADDDDGMGIARQIGFQPQRAFQIQIVGRFVQQQQIGLAEQHPRQGDPHPPPARKVARRSRLIGGRKAQTVQDRGRPRLGRPGVDIDQPRLDLGDAMGIGGAVAFGHQRRAFLIGIQHRIQNRAVIARRLLRHATNAGAGRQADLPPIQRQFAPDQPKQRGLAGAIGPDKTNLVTGGNGGRGTLEQRTALNGIGYVINAQHGLRHGPSTAPRQWPP